MSKIKSFLSMGRIAKETFQVQDIKIWFKNEQLNNS